MQPLTVLIIDDNPDFRAALTAHLQGCPRVGRVVQLSPGEADPAVLDAQRPDLVLLGVLMPGSEAQDWQRLIKSRPQPPRLVFMSMLDPAAVDGDPHIAAADGYLPKQQAVAELPALLNTLFGGTGG